MKTICERCKARTVHQYDPAAGGVEFDLCPQCGWEKYGDPPVVRVDLTDVRWAPEANAY